ncbi:sugar ABC transporter substrate-binding protein [Desulfosporosinus meridiei]|uniref:Monosaccharide ABC transporter substrate-binding protein, CUT2 family n=1 Tax=Desulfosporosinus meridiei (strain ATCC BAA-275 / DSM 13257 / KCTC 12902 / NCIMB 13706 / S10) TaxID=768704 RepID=J7J2A7_DESMD|nr:sugar ABC transporter substrate-binding protein [Desulfosporosinus meridiei]AFQ45433.1 monosaccharide ABC transporter substrate-binding protein, CUT2 family [Desulfosporosinus meridiei DSM 13257]
MKRILVCVLILFSLILTGCGQKIQNENPDNPDNDSQQIVNIDDDKDIPDIAIVMKTLTNPFFIEMEKGARLAQNELGVNLIVKTGAKETSIEQQIGIVEELINSKVDAIVIAPGSSTDLIPVLQKAQKANISIVNIDNRLDPNFLRKMNLTDIPFISVNNEDGAYKSAKYIADQINKPTKVAILEGIRGADNSEQRKKGALKAFAENPNIQIVAMESANWKIDDAFFITSSIFAKYPDIGGIFCANDMMALGAIQYLDKSNRSKVLVAGFDDLREAEKAISKGSMQVTINQHADIQGYRGVHYAYEMIKGKKQPSETFIDVKLVTKATID